MNNEGKKRQPRTPLTPEEVTELFYLKKIREHKKTAKFKKSPVYRIFNVINIVSFFIYCELICCFVGPVSYQTHYNKLVSVEYGEIRSGSRERPIEVVTMYGVNNERYKFVVREMIEVPARFSAFEVGSDFLLGKEIKGRFPGSEQVYKLEKASPILFLSIFVGLFSLIIFGFDLNQNVHSLTAISAINILTVFAFLLI